MPHSFWVPNAEGRIQLRPVADDRDYSSDKLLVDPNSGQLWTVHTKVF